MAGDWIKMRSALRSSPKVVRIASALKADGCPDRLRVVGALHAVWSLADEHSADGRLDGYTLETLDDLIGWSGFSAALLGVDWLKIDKQGIEVPRFDEHNGASAKRRAMESERKRRGRIESGQTSASKADKKRTREEKRIYNPIVPETFAKFWNAYPRKQAKQKALSAFQKLSFSNGDFDRLLSALEAAKLCEEWQKEGGKYVPHAATWLNGRRFEDELPKPGTGVASIYRREGAM